MKRCEERDERERERKGAGSKSPIDYQSKSTTILSTPYNVMFD